MFVLSSIYRSSLCSWLISKFICNRFFFFSVPAFSISWKYRIRKTFFHYAVFNQFTQPNLIKATKTPGVTECERNGVRAINEWGSRSLNMVLHLQFLVIVVDRKERRWKTDLRAWHKLLAWNLRLDLTISTVKLGPSCQSRTTFKFGNLT